MEIEKAAERPRRGAYVRRSPELKTSTGGAPCVPGSRRRQDGDWELFTDEPLA